jgi:hypothetical protein
MIILARLVKVQPQLIMYIAAKDYFCGVRFMLQNLSLIKSLAGLKNHFSKLISLLQWEWTNNSHPNKIIKLVDATIHEIVCFVCYRLETVEKLLRTHPELIRQYSEAPPRTVFPLTPLHRACKNGHK